MTLDPHEIAIRIALAIIFGAIVGVEREWRHKTAGIKTNTLVAIGAASFSMMSNTFGPINHNPAQLAAAVVGGIGFIGAGVIIHRGTNVQGVTTAATLWANASMGVAVGLGYYEIGAMTCLGMLVVQFGLRKLERLVSRRAPHEREIEVRVECSDSALPAVAAAWKSFATSRDIHPLRHSISRTANAILWRAVFIVSPTHGLDLTSIEEQIVAVPGVQKIEARQTAPGDETAM